MIFQWFFINNELWHPKKSWFFNFSFIYKQKMKKIMILGEDTFFQFWVHLDPILIKISRFHALQQEKLVTKVIFISLSWTMTSTLGNSAATIGDGRNLFGPANCTGEHRSEKMGSHKTDQPSHWTRQQEWPSHVTCVLSCGGAFNTLNNNHDCQILDERITSHRANFFVGCTPWRSNFLAWLQNRKKFIHFFFTGMGRGIIYIPAPLDDEC